MTPAWRRELLPTLAFALLSTKRPSMGAFSHWVLRLFATPLGVVALALTLMGSAHVIMP